MTTTQGSRELAAAVRILRGPLARKVGETDIDAAAELINWEAIADRCHSSTEDILYRAAWSLWNSGSGVDEVTLAVLVCLLDDRQLRAVIDAIAILRPGVVGQ